jgi:glycosyltransferase involved in cell wall biosynthesis
MKYHVVMDRDIKLDELRRQSERGLCPRHAMALLVERLGGAVHVPDPDRDPPTRIDRLRWKLFSPGPAAWSLGRRLGGELGRDDAVFCLEESTGIPLVAALGGRAVGARVCVFVHTHARPRGRAAARVTRLGRRAAAFGACCRRQYDFLRDRLGVPESKLHLILEHVDNRFFTPGPPSPGKARPLIIGVGLENRDYRTLARAIADLDVDVRISGFSRYAAAQWRSFPDPMPANMMQRFYPWPELVQLYRDADVVVVPVFPSRYAAGVTSILEGMACRRPVVATRSPGLSDYLDPQAGLSIVEPFDADGLRQAIVHLLEDPDEAQDRAESGYRRIASRHDFDRSFEGLVRLMESL